MTTSNSNAVRRRPGKTERAATPAPQRSAIADAARAASAQRKTLSLPKREGSR